MANMVRGPRLPPNFAIAKSLRRTRASVKVKAHRLNLSLAQKPRRKLKAAFGAPISLQGIRLNETAHKVDRADASRGTNAHWGERMDNKTERDSPRLPAGTRVRLRSIVVASMAHNQRRLPIDWANRRGVVESCTSLVVRIIWDGRQSSDPWPRQAVEKDAV